MLMERGGERERERDVPVCTSHLLFPVNMNVPEVKAVVPVGYFQDVWMNGPFPIRRWNAFDAYIRTNSRVEGWHNKLNRTVGFHHLNVFQLVEVLTKQQVAIESTETTAQHGAEPPARRRKYHQQDVRLERLRQGYSTGEMTTEQFLLALRHIVHHF